MSTFELFAKIRAIDVTKPHLKLNLHTIPEVNSSDQTRALNSTFSQRGSYHGNYQVRKGNCRNYSGNCDRGSQKGRNFHRRSESDANTSSPISPDLASS